MHKIVALWCHPRSMSTSVERLMRERGDFECLHEPFMYHYYLNQKHRAMPYFEPKPDHPVTYDAVRDMIFDKVASSPVFFKDMAYYIERDIVTDASLTKFATHCFLIRNPQAAIASYYKLDKAVTQAEIGIEAQWRVYNYLVESGNKPVVIQAESIRKDAHAAVKYWWDSIGLTHKDSAFEWSQHSPKDWEQVKGWHQESIQSTSIRPWTESEIQNATDRFEVAANEAPHLRTYLAHHKPYYDRLKDAAL